MASAAEEYRAFLREVIEVTRAATDAVDESQEVIAEVRHVLEKCVAELTALREHREAEHALRLERIHAATVNRGKAIEVCKSIVDSRWFAAIAPMVITWGMVSLAWYFGSPAPIVPLPPVPESTPAAEVPDVGTQ